MLPTRKPLRAEVGAEILGRIVDGRLQPGTRINESHLAQDLGISRTPLREALLCLASSGTLGTDMGRGFTVPHLCGREVVELLEALSVVVPAALRLGHPLALKDQIEARNMLGRARMDCGRPAVFCEHFYRFLRLLAARGGNTTLQRECERLAQLLLRYLHEALVRGWDPMPTLANLQETLEAFQHDPTAATASGFERVFTQMSTCLAERFTAMPES